jgi:hypothetical protein
MSGTLHLFRESRLLTLGGSWSVQPFESDQDAEAALGTLVQLGADDAGGFVGVLVPCFDHGAGVDDAGIEVVDVDECLHVGVVVLPVEVGVDVDAGHAPTVPDLAPISSVSTDLA